ncbi:MAG: NAD(P)-dependent oxidoreductase [Chloroflexota bacterium]
MPAPAQCTRRNYNAARTLQGEARGWRRPWRREGTTRAVKVGFIGLGQMGNRMARNVAKAGHELAVYDVRPEATSEIAQAAGARAATSPGDAARDADVVCTSLPAPRDVESVVTGPNGLLENMKAGSVYIDLSTNAPSMVRKLSALLKEKGIDMLDAPVSGGVGGAENGTLSIMCGGEKAVYERVQPVLSAMGTKLFHCGASGAGSVVKLCNNIAGQAHAVIMGEVLSLGVRAGVELKTLASVIAVSTGTNSRLTGSFPRRLFRRQFEHPGFSAYLSHKDTHLALDLAHELGVPLAMGEVVGSDMDEVIERGWGSLDFDIVARIQEDRAGVELKLTDEELQGYPPPR